jgi:hypothetical protein
VEQSDQTTCVADCLFVPDDLFASTRAGILRFVLVFFASKLLVCLAHGKDKQQGVGRARYEGEQLGFVDAEHVVESKLLGKAKLVDERGHDLRVVLYKTRRVSADAPACRAMSYVLPRGMNLFFPAGTSGLSSAMLVVSVWWNYVQSNKEGTVR